MVEKLGQCWTVVWGFTSDPTDILCSHCLFGLNPALPSCMPNHTPQAAAKQTSATTFMRDMHTTQAVSRVAETNHTKSASAVKSEDASSTSNMDTSVVATDVLLDEYSFIAQSMEHDFQSELWQYDPFFQQ